MGKTSPSNVRGVDSIPGRGDGIQHALWPKSHGILQAGVGCHFLLQGIPDPVIEPRSPTLQADALTFEPPGKPVIDNVRYYYLICNLLCLLSSSTRM